uniref:Regulator of microtubule dynamics protein 2 n=1 Tax=Lepeophtheirus salmonis TaxID=72036 RepID=A0A0K2TDR0_LEPSM
MLSKFVPTLISKINIKSCDIVIIIVYSCHNKLEGLKLKLIYLSEGPFNWLYISVIKDMMGGSEKSKLVLIGALGAGCVIGASGIILIQRLSHRMESSVPMASTNAIRRELMSIHSEIQELHLSIDELKQRHPPKSKALKSSLRSVTFADVEESFQERRRHSEVKSNEQTTINSNESVASSSFFSANSSSSDDEEQEFFDIESDTSTGSSQISASDKKIIELFNRIDELLEGQPGEQKLAYVLLKENEPEYKENSEFLWRLCKSMYMMAIIVGTEGDMDRKKELIFQSVGVGKRSLDMNDNSAEAHKWYAIAIGTKGEYLGLKEKILDGYTFKNHIDCAGKLAPLDHSIQHLLGRFCYEVAELSWFERKMASTLFADPPSSSMEEAYSHFCKAEELKVDGWKENRLFLAKCSIRMQNYSLAREWLESAIKLPVMSADDQQVDEEARKLMDDYAGYCDAA